MAANCGSTDQGRRFHRNVSVGSTIVIESGEYWIRLQLEICDAPAPESCYSAAR